jgi:hypothetical protein
VVFVFVETLRSTGLIQDYLSDDEHSELQAAIAENPEAGVVIPGSGSVKEVAMDDTRSWKTWRITRYLLRQNPR